MRTDDFQFELPAELIAQEPAPRREEARLFVHETSANRSRHAIVKDLPEVLRAGDLLVFNDTRVRPLRLFGRRVSGGVVEFLLVEKLAADEFVQADSPKALTPKTKNRWRALVHPARKLKPGERVALQGDQCGMVMVERPVLENGELDAAWIVRFDLPDGDSEDDWIEALGKMPLPPYIRRPRGTEDALDALDRERYQTVYAREPGAVAAPTAGLHFTPELIERLRCAGIESCFVTLHVGEGTFLPVKVDDLEDHRMHSERYVLTGETVQAIENCRARNGRVVAVGTTSVRVLESCVDETGCLRAGEGSTDIFLYPGRQFRVVDVLFTNFHLPASTLLMLVSAFAGQARTLALYAEAVKRSYRFFSYGDAMLIEREDASRNV
ncbi:MAG: S-adenosylmethionine:tRNA ribosyltransferase-isomerase [Planctomycetota bacterium]|jgi:S-adenosylmethionine:tRNA ribosyltransferase-isomerase